MQRFALLGSTALGIVVGAILFNAKPAFADLPVIDPASIAEEVKELAKDRRHSQCPAGGSDHR